MAMQLVARCHGRMRRRLAPDTMFPFSSSSSLMVLELLPVVKW